MILGIDEVGRGPWAGPLVVGAVILGVAEIDGLNDSKKLTKKRREVLDVEIREKAAAWALGWVSAQELDEGGMSAALRLATRRAVEQIQVQCREKSVTFDEIIIDGTVNFLADTALGRYVTVMARADGLVPSVSAASIIAKVTRDAYMCEQDDVYPGYGFAGNAGYGVAKHRAAIEKLGVCPEHRLSFAPLQKYSTAGLLPSSEAPLAKYVAERESDGDSSVEEAVTGVKPRQPNATGAQPRKEYSEADESLSRTQSTRDIGNRGEQAAVDWLMADGHEIIERNWRTRWCEIDIVSKKDATLYFIEVKYRKNANYGDGLAAITAKKQQQIRFAAEFFLVKHSQYSEYDVQLLAADVSGDPASVQQVVVVE